MPKRRPFSVTLLLLMVLSLSGWGAVRFAAALRWQDVLNEFEASLSPLYLTITGAGWVVVGIALLIGLLNRIKRTLPAIIASMVIWLLEYWGERIFFQSTRANLPFALTCSILAIAVTWILTNLPGTQSFFTRSEEHEQPVEKQNTR